MPSTYSSQDIEKAIGPIAARQLLTYSLKNASQSKEELENLFVQYDQIHSSISFITPAETMLEILKEVHAS